MGEPSIADLEKELEQEVDVDVSLDQESTMMVYARMRHALVREYQELALAARLHRKVGDEQRAEAQYTEAKKLLNMVKELDLERDGKNIPSAAQVQEAREHTGANGSA